MTRFKAVFFDFDGTLVLSARAKYQAFFEVFAKTPAHHAIIEAVLAADPDGSRHVVIPAMAAEMSARGLAPAPRDPVAAYGDAVLAAVMACPEAPGATALLRNLATMMPVFIMSNTPHDALTRLVGARGWDKLVTGCFGYPAQKADIITGQACRLGISDKQVAVVGDGISDQIAATKCNAFFFPVSDAMTLAETGPELTAHLGADHV